MARSYRDLQALSDDDLVDWYDQKAKNTMIGLNFVRQELAIRAQDRQTREMLALTRQIRWMTVIVTVATIVNVLVAVLD